MDFHHPLFQSVVVPFAFALVLAGALGYVAMRAIAAASVALALLLAAAAILAGFSWPPLSAVHKWPWGVAAGLAAGIALDFGGARPRTVAATGSAIVLVALAWFAWPLADRLGPGAGIALAAAAGTGVAILACLAATEATGARRPAWLVAAGLGLAGVAFVGGSLKLAQLAGALAAAAGGYALWNWPRPRHTFGAAGLIGAGTAWITLAYLTLLLTHANRIALLLLAASAVAGPLARRLPLGRLDRHVAEPVLIALLAALPIAAAIALGAQGAPAPDADDPYYH